MKIKKITALVLTMVIGASIFAGCSKTYTSVVTIDGEGVKPGTYLLAQLQAYSKASQKIEGDEELLKATIEEKPAQQWIKDETMKILSTNAFYDKEFEKRGLELSEDEIAQIKTSTSSVWQSNLEPLYKPNGISLETYTAVVTGMYKRDKIFFDIYGEGKEKAPTAEESAKYIDENYSRIKGFQISKQDVEGKVVSEDAVKQLLDAAKDAQKELDDGADFEETRIKYMRIGGTVVGLTTGFGSEEEFTLEQYIKKDIEQFPEALVNDLFAAEIDGKYHITEMDQYILVYKRIANDDNQIDYAGLKTSIVTEMKNDEFTKYVDECAAKLELKADEGAVNYYSVAKIKQ